MKKSLLISSLILMAPICFSQMPVSYEAIYDCHKNSYVLVSSELFTVKNLFQKKFDVPVYSFTGTDSHGINIIGSFVKYDYKAADNLFLTAKFSYCLRQNEKWSPLIFVGFNIRGN